jgi:proteasome assembly chaperone (PAC2) family protein
MGNVGMIAAGFLAAKMGAKPVAELPAEGFFDIEAVGVRGGVIVPPRLPRSVFHSFKVATGPEVLVFVGEAQPARDSYAFARKLLDKATELGVNRVMTFASMASQLHPAATPRAFGVVTQPDMKADVTRLGAELLEDGRSAG